MDLNQNVNNIFARVVASTISSSLETHAIFNNFIDICDMFKKRTESLLYNIFFKEHETYGNLTTSSTQCPILKGNYYLKNFKVNLNYTPTFFPPSKFI